MNREGGRPTGLSPLSSGAVGGTGTFTAVMSGRGTALHPVTAQTYTNTRSLTLSRNEGLILQVNRTIVRAFPQWGRPGFLRTRQKCPWRDNSRLFSMLAMAADGMQ
jgi:hypothetical protein